MGFTLRMGNPWIVSLGLSECSWAPISEALLGTLVGALYSLRHLFGNDSRVLRHQNGVGEIDENMVVPRCGHNATVSGRHGFESCGAEQPSSILGQMGGLHRHGSSKTPRRRHTHHPVDARPPGPPTLVRDRQGTGVGRWVRAPFVESPCEWSAPLRDVTPKMTNQEGRHDWQHEAASRVQRQGLV